MTTLNGAIVMATKTFEYVELSTSKTRGIGIWVKGIVGGRTDYDKLIPNPHDDKWYNKHQVAFYKEAAVAIGTYYNANNDSFPPEGFVINVNNIDYELTSR